jgi:hypothetical protein
MILPKSSSVSGLNISDGMPTTLRPSGRTPRRMMRASSASEYMRTAAVRSGAASVASSGSSMNMPPSISDPWQPPAHPRSVASRRPSAMDWESVGMTIAVNASSYFRRTMRSEST